LPAALSVAINDTSTPGTLAGFEGDYELELEGLAAYCEAQFQSQAA
jgi:hypothetical protein